MKIGIMQPYLFPYIGYWQLVNKVDKYVIYDDVNFIKGGWINRNRILMNNDAKIFSIQMKGASPNKLINEVEVSDNMLWKKKLIKMIENCYIKSPYFNNIFPIICDIINYNEANLAKYIENSIRVICNYLDIDTEIILSSSLSKNNELKAQDKVIDICKSLNAKEYYNAIGGQKLYSYKVFKENNIDLKFLVTEDIKYSQYNNNFVENLSIIDVLMFNSKEQVIEIINMCKLI